MDEAYRLTFEVEGEELALRSIRRLVMRAPAGETHMTSDGTVTGHFVELRGKKGDALYRRQISALVPERREYPTGDPRQPFGLTGVGPRTLVSVIVPAHERARSLVLVHEIGRRPSLQKGAKAAAPMRRDLLFVDLTDSRESR
jgi:hypothetical protein